MWLKLRSVILSRIIKKQNEKWHEILFTCRNQVDLLAVDNTIVMIRGWEVCRKWSRQGRLTNDRQVIVTWKTERQGDILLHSAEVTDNDMIYGFRGQKKKKKTFWMFSLKDVINVRARAVAQLVKLLSAVLSSHLRVPIQFPAALLPIWIPGIHPGRDGSCPNSSTHVADQDRIPSSWFWSSPSLVVAAILTVNHRWRMSLSLSLFVLLAVFLLLLRCSIKLKKFFKENDKFRARHV